MVVEEGVVGVVVGNGEGVGEVVVGSVRGIGLGIEGEVEVVKGVVLVRGNWWVGIEYVVDEFVVRVIILGLGILGIGDMGIWVRVRDEILDEGWMGGCMERGGIVRVRVVLGMEGDRGLVGKV